MRAYSAFLLIFVAALAGCNRGGESKDAVKQGIVEHLKARQFNMETMAVEVTAVKFNGSKADAQVSIAPKGASSAQGMSMNYQLEKQGEKWVVVNRQDAAGSAHGSGMMPGGTAPEGAAPGAANPHGGSQMPSPESLPPATKKK